MSCLTNCQSHDHWCENCIAEFNHLKAAIQLIERGNEMSKNNHKGGCKDFQVDLGSRLCICEYVTDNSRVKDLHGIYAECDCLPCAQTAWNINAALNTADEFQTYHAE